MTIRLPTAICLTVRHAWLMLPLLGLAGGWAEGQRASAISLPPADGTLSEEFIQIVAVRELRDGRVLVSDRRENRVVVADFRSQRVAPVTRTGSGPREFRRADLLFGITGDSTILDDPGNGRWLLLHADSVVATLPPDTPVVERTRPLVGADSLGHVLGEKGAVNALQTLAGNPVDSFRVVLVDRASGRVDTVARLAAPQIVRPTVVSNPDTRVRTVSFSIPGWAAGEQATLLRDGWVAIARLNPYRVDWRSPEGRMIRGTALPFTPVRMDEREKRAFMERTARRTGRAARSPDSIADWPEEIPPFSSVSAVLSARSPALQATPHGRLLILRMPTAATPETRYDVIDRSGTLVGELKLPAPTRPSPASAHGPFTSSAPTPTGCSDCAVTAGPDWAQRTTSVPRIVGWNVHM